MCKLCILHGASFSLLLVLLQGPNNQLKCVLRIVQYPLLFGIDYI